MATRLDLDDRHHTSARATRIPRGVTLHTADRGDGTGATGRNARRRRPSTQGLRRQDPALACKLLRVVNSSLYGLHRPVADLNQAIGLLGIKPLKLLVLGFNLPDSLFAEVAARELEWYWTNTLTRAVAARMLGEQLWHDAGDEAFIAGLLQDIGILVLLRELGEPYARFLTGVIDEKCHLAVLEQDTLGFDHLQLTAALLAKWQLPQRLVNAIEVPKRTSRLDRVCRRRKVTCRKSCISPKCWRNSSANNDSLCCPSC